MVISFVLSTATDLTVYTLKCIYSFGRYLVYGHEETEAEKLDRFILEFTELKREVVSLKESSLQERIGAEQRIYNEQRIKDNSNNTKDVKTNNN